MTLVPPIGPKRSREDERSDQGLERRHLWAGLVRHREPKRMPAHRTDELTMERFAIALPERPGRLAERTNRLPQFGR
jgi:hypothetical protein